MTRLILPKRLSPLCMAPWDEEALEYSVGGRADLCCRQLDSRTTTGLGLVAESRRRCL
jgi:hypothetical protein